MGLASGRLGSVRAVIFDLDGTLADSMEYYHWLACDLVEHAGAPPVSRERVHELMGQGDSEILRKLLPPDFPDPEPTIQRVLAERARHWMRAGEEIEPLPGCLELIRALHARPCSLGIASSSGRAGAHLERWGVHELFGAIVGREDVSQRKPHPEPVLLCASRLGLEPAEAVYVGDSPVDIEAGQAAGMRTIGVLTGTSTRERLTPLDPDHILESAIELLDLLD
jgi:HAD superfamily hydrolase (TIGR01509 family)